MVADIKNETPTHGVVTLVPIAFNTLFDRMSQASRFPSLQLSNLKNDCCNPFEHVPDIYKDTNPEGAMTFLQMTRNKNH